ncbi:hypothetical protein [Winogradskyella sp. UBA3174]|uniref:hypothetical protein n=1 Tax=Winogradskyella sp. UBA3174 TaxID=1947785 RepID=UPI0025FE013A|nr:hypothetical protein [Winogradskyella sp. UBA3174]
MLHDFFDYLCVVLIIVNAALFIYSYKENRRNLSYRLFCMYLIISVVINLFVIILGSYKINNLYFSHYYFILQFILLSLFYRTLFIKNQKQIVSAVLVTVVGILSIQYAYSPELYFKFNTTEVFLTCFPIVVYAMIHLYNSLNKSPKYLYINAGILIYLATSTLIFILGDYLSGSNTGAVNNIWLINKVLYATYLALILTEWWKNFRLIKNK